MIADNVYVKKIYTFKNLEKLARIFQQERLTKPDSFNTFKPYFKDCYFNVKSTVFWYKSINFG